MASSRSSSCSTPDVVFSPGVEGPSDQSTPFSNVSDEEDVGIIRKDSQMTVSFHHLRWSFQVSATQGRFLRPHLELLPLYLSQINNDCSDTVAVKISSNLVLACSLLGYLIELNISRKLLQIVVEEFEQDFLSELDIHNMAVTLEGPTRTFVLKAYYSALQAANLQPRPADSALFRSAETKDTHIYAVFGGQGTSNPDCLKQLHDLVSIYVGVLDELIEAFARIIGRLVVLPRTRAFYEIHGFDIKRWIAQPATFPDRKYIASAPVSFPLNGLVSLSHYYVACKALGRHPGEMRKCLRGVTGHSQGVVVAAAIAKADSWGGLIVSAEWVAETLFWIGFESHEATTSGDCISASIVDRSVAFGENSPSPMLSVRGLHQSALENAMAEANAYYHKTKHVHLSLINSRDNMVVSGPPKSLMGLSQLLRNLRAEDGADQSRVPFNLRKPVVQLQFLPISAHFHSPHLSHAVKRVLEALPTRSPKVELGVALYHTSTGEDLRGISSEDLTERIVKMIMTDLVNWPRACRFSGATHILDFGPGHVSALLREKMEGAGCRVIMATELDSYPKRSGSKAELFSPKMPTGMPNWGDLYKPRLQRTTDGKVKLVTKMTELLGTPPVMVAGMTPTTLHWDFVSAVMIAGYHVELAGGGYSKPNDFETAIRTLSENVPRGRGITLNLIYVAPRQMAWQIPLIGDLIQKGVLIEGLTIGAGIPSTEIVGEYIDTLGLRHISFKPGTYQSLLDVVKIAKAYPKFPIGLQWTGGRAGGHHSFEDFHLPIITAYGSIRECANIVLIAGSGFGASEDTYPYLTGEWSATLGYPQMPFDGILLGSRMMAAKEAHTSLLAKQLIVETEGVTDSQWPGTYKEATGGIVTVNSEMGQPIHKLATRGVLLWRELDETIFSIRDPIKRLDDLRRSRNYIIDRLNKDFQKPWFAVNSDGRSVDIQDMTYMEVLRRLTSLMYVKDQQRWIDPSYQRLVLDVTTRIQERLVHVTNLSLDKIADPAEFLIHVSHCIPLASEKLVEPEDASHILGLFGRRGQKPVNFIPALDERFEQWFKKDSLWQVEDLDAVVDRDVQRICIIHGPVAARHSRIINEPVETILNDITRSHTEMLQRDGYSVNEFAVDHHCFNIRECPSFLDHTSITESATEKVYIFPKCGPLPEHDLLILDLVRGMPGWAEACFTDKWIYQGRHRQSNPIRSVFTPRHGYLLRIHRGANREVISVSLSKQQDQDGRDIGELAEVASTDGNRVTVTLLAGPSNSNAIEFKFDYVPGAKVGRLSEDMRGRNDRIRSFYAGLWIGLPSLNAYPDKTFHGGHVVLSKALVSEFMGVLGNSIYDSHPNNNCVPIDIGIFIAWKALVMPLLTKAVDGDLLRLLHQSNKFDYFPAAKPFQLGDNLETTSRIGSIITQTDKKLLEVIAVIRRQGDPVMTVTSVFVIQGTFSPYDNSFKCHEEPHFALQVVSTKIDALLRSRDWLKLDEEGTDLIGRRLVFKLNSRQDYVGTGPSFRLQVIGQLFLCINDNAIHKVGRINFNRAKCHGNPVTDFLKRHGTSLNDSQALANPDIDGNTAKIRLPLSNAPYSRASKDTNPIHTSHIFSSYIQLPGPITHGMHTSAAVRRVVEKSVAAGDATRFRKYSASFQGMALPGDELRIEWQHVGMIEGRMQIKIQAYNDQINTKVLDAEAEIEQAQTAYVFTGQGSQEKGMGMELYRSSDAARHVWDRGDSHLMDLYGFSIIEIVQRDPKSLTLHFRGIRGRKIRERFLAMTTEKSLAGGTKVQKCIIEGLTSTSTSYTFHDVRGLLYSTQFAQPALVLMQMAVFADMKSKGLIQKNAAFAGHSLGEYAALGAMTEFLPLEPLLDLVFYRGLVMQSAIEKDSLGQSDFSMVAVNPSRLSKGFPLKDFHRIIQTISEETGLLLEVVNHNIEGQQYVCAGHLHALWIMSELFNRLSRSSKLNASEPAQIFELVREYIPKLQQLPKMVKLERGVATVPLSGIDIPFHSQYLRGGIDSYRKFLLRTISEHDIDPRKLVGKFIPNVMGSPFSTGPGYIEKVSEVTGSMLLKSLILQPIEA